MPTLDDLPTPALVLDLDRLESNLGRMAEKAGAHGVALRPHFKTHKCVEIARLQAARGARGFTVSTLEEGRVLLDHGFDDLTWAYPVIPGRIAEARALADRGTLRLLVDSPEAIDALESAGFGFHVWLKVDCGYHRAGVDPALPEAEELAARLATSRKLRFDGILTHSGHAYHFPAGPQVGEIAEQERRVMADFAERLRGHGIEVPGVSIGSTPALAAARNLTGVTEIRPGNYAFLDYTQTLLGSGTPADCAVTVLSTVISSPPGAGHSVADAGALALSRDPGPSFAPTPTLGEVYLDYEAGALDPDLRLVGLSQEHGVLSRRLPYGTRLRILPNHSCLAAACFDLYHAVRGATLEQRWRVWRSR